MLGDFFSFYLTSLGEFWGSAIRIGLPQILLVILLICWLRRKGSGKSCSKSCCWIWSCGTGGSSWCCPEDDSGDRASAPCGCTCGGCRCQVRKSAEPCCDQDTCEIEADEE